MSAPLNYNYCNEIVNIFNFFLADTGLTFLIQYVRITIFIIIFFGGQKVRFTVL